MLNTPYLMRKSTSIWQQENDLIKRRSEITSLKTRWGSKALTGFVLYI